MNAIKEKLNIGSSASADTRRPEPTPEALSQLKEKYTKAGQDHVFTFYDSLSSEDKGRLYEQLSGFDPAHINDINRLALAATETHDAPALVEPLPESATASILDSSQEDLEKWNNLGLDLIGANKVAVVLLAGGQGTRLGSSAPKGCFNIGLPSKKSLFQIQAERILKMQKLAAAKLGNGEKVVVPWYIMTSGPTRAPTEAFFKEQNYFGLEKENIRVFNQGVLPCMSNEGKILLQDKSTVAVAPDGNGGIYNGLVLSGVMDDMRKRGIEHIHNYGVDNCLVKVADPVFVGFAAALEVDVATKVVRKRNATESVGLIVCRNGKPDVVEYSEIAKEMAEAEDPKHPGILKFRAANIVNHYYSLRFLESIPQWAHKMPHHVARKKIPYTDINSGEVIKPESPNGIKLEQFVFDVFPLVPLNKFACMEVLREDEFSPLKNAVGTADDNADTSKRDIMAQGQRWAEKAGAIVVSEGGVEVSPLISYGGEGLEKLQGTTITAPAVLELE